MRVPASYKAFQALAFLSLMSALLVFSPAELAATTRHARRTAEVSARKPGAKKHTQTRGNTAKKKGGSSRKGQAKAPVSPSVHRKHLRRRRQVDDQADPVTINRVHAWEKVQKTSPAASQLSAEREGQRDEIPQPRKATSEDFLKAASPTAYADDSTRGVSKPAEGDETGPRVTTPHLSRERNTSTPTPVVNLVRPTRQRPQLPPVEEVASTPEILPSLYNKRGRLIMPRPLKGSREILLRQNQVADSEGLDRIRNDEDIESMRQQRTLVALPVSAGLEVDERLPSNRRYCRPWTAVFLENLSRAHYQRFHTPLQVNSAVRTVEFQQRLLHTNGNAAPAEGDLASPHLTGQTIDLAKHGLSMTEIAWMRGYLLPLVQQGRVDVEEEFQQSCFHVSVYKRYLPSGHVPKREIATTHREGTSTLAAAMP